MRRRTRDLSEGLLRAHVSRLTAHKRVHAHHKALSSVFKLRPSCSAQAARNHPAQQCLKRRSTLVLQACCRPPSTSLSASGVNICNQCPADQRYTQANSVLFGLDRSRTFKALACCSVLWTRMQTAQSKQSDIAAATSSTCALLCEYFTGCILCHAHWTVLSR